MYLPFAPESELSGIAYTGFMPSVWYKRTLKIPVKYQDHRVILHFGAVYYYTSVYLNSHLVGEHRGGYTPFQIDVTAFLLEGENLLVVGVNDDNRSGLQPRGKQAQSLYSRGCYYTRTTGIWQTVWLEFVSPNYIEELKIIPDWHNCRVIISGFVKKNTQSQNGKIAVEVSYDHKIVGEGSQLTNGRPIFQRLVLGQGYYPDGVYTAREENLLKKDIEIAQL